MGSELGTLFKANQIKSIQFRLIALLLLAFFFQNLLHFIVLSFAPFEVKGSLLPAYLLLGLFGLTFSIAATTIAFFKKSQWKASSFEYFSLNSSNKILKELLFISVIGLILHCFSKAYVLELYKIDCLSQIRFVWINADRTLSPSYVRLASILGHLLSSFIYVGVGISSMFFIAFTKNSERMHYRSRVFFYLIAFLVFGLIYSLAIGSRNCALTFFIMSVGGVILGIVSQPINNRQVVRALCVMSMALILTYGGVSLFTSNRIFCGHHDPGNSSKVIANYNEGNLKQFSNITSAEWTHSENSFWTKCNACGTYALYLSHAVINLSMIMDSDQRGDYESNKSFIYIAKRLGIFTSTNDQAKISRAYGPGFLPLVGSVYYDGGVHGVVWLLLAIIGILYLILIGITSVRYTVFSLGAFFILFYMLMTSNLLTATNAMPFPFILFAFTFLGVYCRLIEDWKQSPSSY